MGSRLNPDRFDCAAAALPDEPTFTLLARDPSAPNLVRDWARIRRRLVGWGYRPIEDMAMVGEARDCADAMAVWRETNWPHRKGEKVEPTTVSLEIHDARVTELLQVNNREVERRRAAERELADLRAEILNATSATEA